MVDARARRKRRQLSSSSYYISSINPYAGSIGSVALTYPSGSYYSAPSYGYPDTGYSSSQYYDSNYYGAGLNQYGQGNLYTSCTLM